MLSLNSIQATQVGAARQAHIMPYAINIAKIPFAFAKESKKSGKSNLAPHSACTKLPNNNTLIRAVSRHRRKQ